MDEPVGICHCGRVQQIVDGCDDFLQKRNTAFYLSSACRNVERVCSAKLIVDAIDQSIAIEAEEEAATEIRSRFTVSTM